jgi:hypothetical protein
MRFAHYVVTRFNLGLWAAGQKNIRGETIDPELWMHHRTALFSDVCSPSIASQSERRFAWVLLLDTDTPRRVVQSIETSAAKAARVKIAIVDTRFGWRMQLKKFLSAILPPGIDYVMTTRLDNDDALSRDAIGSIQACFAPRRKRLIVFPRGLRWCAGRVFAAYADWDSNAFKTLSEKVSETPLATVFEQACGTGGWLDTEIVQKRTGPTWLQVIHEHNLANTLAPDDHESALSSLQPFSVRLCALSNAPDRCQVTA